MTARPTATSARWSERCAANQHQSVRLRAPHSLLKSYHASNVQRRILKLDARIAATSRDDVASLNRLQSEKIALRKSHATPPTLSAA